MRLSKESKNRIKEKNIKVEVTDSSPDAKETTLEELIEDCYTIFGEDCDLELAFSILEEVGVPVKEIKSKSESE